ncbi:prolyl oligopeptidase family serine peptidase [Kribbella sp. NPDC003557]|uniref:prolyl oligopeptidase family serine peptidase n=1 Tax=Kribbella sp. NPDC003557 TaxID=3154449 RepID=UPI0033AC77ED
MPKAREETMEAVGSLVAGAGVHRLARRDRSGVEREYLVAVPDRPVFGVTVLFHPFGFTPEAVLIGEPAGELLIRPLDGALGPAEATGQIVVAPRSHGRVLAGVSLAWQDHLDATWSVVRELCEFYGTDAVAVGGLSMGGQEALVLAAQHADEVRTVWAANPVVDLTRWHDDIRDCRASEALLDADATIREEVGGAPSERPDEYARRSPISYATELARTTVRLVWSGADTIIPGQGTYHAHALAEQLRALGGPVDERIVTHAPGSPADEPGRFAHEACDMWEHLGWAAANAQA